VDNFGSHERLGERLLAPKEGLCSMELATYRVQIQNIETISNAPSLPCFSLLLARQ
jgi:hypothetical protein